MRRALNLRLACQATAMKVSANLTVQLITRWRSPETAVFDAQQVLEFAIYGALGSQIGNMIQFALEDMFPNPKGSDDPSSMASAATVLPATAPMVEEKKDDDLAKRTATSSWRPRQRWKCPAHLSLGGAWRPVLVKLVLDQTIGLFISGCVFLTCTNIARVSHPALVVGVIRARIWPLIRAGWHIWPLVALCNFLWVPVRSRVLVAVCVGFGWSIFLSVFAMRK